MSDRLVKITNFYKNITWVIFIQEDKAKVANTLTKVYEVAGIFDESSRSTASLPSKSVPRATSLESSLGARYITRIANRDA